MSLIRCKECGYEISDSAISCPRCGKPVEKTKVIDKKVDSFAMFTLVIATIGIMGQVYILYLVPLFWLIFYFAIYEKTKNDPKLDNSDVKKSLIAIFVAFFLPTFFIIIF